MIASQCCGAGVNIEGKTTKWYECRFCNKPCDVTITQEPSCNFCGGPLASNWREGEEVSYCWEHGDQ